MMCRRKIRRGRGLLEGLVFWDYVKAHERSGGNLGMGMWVDL